MLCKMSERFIKKWKNKYINYLNIIVVRSVKNKHEQAEAAGNLLPTRRVALQVPLDSSIVCVLQQIGDYEKERVEMLIEVAFYIALKGYSFAEFKE